MPLRRTPIRPGPLQSQAGFPAEKRTQIPAKRTSSDAITDKRVKQPRMVEEKRKIHNLSFAPWLRKSPTPPPDPVKDPSESAVIFSHFPIAQPLCGLADGCKADDLLQDLSPYLGLPKPKSRVDKAQELALTLVKECGELLVRCLAEDPDNRRILKEEEEYKQIKGRADQGLILTTIERERLRAIKRNTERRVYRTLRDGQDKGGTSDLKPAKKEETEYNLETPPAEQKEKSPPQHISPLSTLYEAAPTSDDTPSSETIDGDTLSSDTELTGFDDEEDETEPPDSLWEYSVYIAENDGLGPPVGRYLSTYYSRARAEARVREEIQACSRTNLLDRTRVEHTTLFEDGGFLGQSLQFASGRTIEVRIEKKLLEGQELLAHPKKQARRQKLEYLPHKVYVITENISELETQKEWSEPALDAATAAEPGSSDDTLMHNPPVRSGTGQPIWKECFVLRHHANAQASRLMIRHRTAHLPEGQKFDLSITGDMDTDAKHYLYMLDEGERHYDKTSILPPLTPHGKKREVTIRVVELLLRGPRN